MASHSHLMPHDPHASTQTLGRQSTRYVRTRSCSPVLAPLIKPRIVSRTVHLSTCLHVAIACLGVLVATSAWGADAVSSKRIQIFGCAVNHPAPDTYNSLCVSVGHDENNPASDYLNVSFYFNSGESGESGWDCWAYGPDEIGAAGTLTVSTAASHGSLQVSTAPLHCGNFGNAPLPTRASMSCNADGQYIDNGTGNVASTTFSGDLAKYHINWTINSAACTGSDDAQ